MTLPGCQVGRPPRQTGRFHGSALQRHASRPRAATSRHSELRRSSQKVCTAERCVRHPGSRFNDPAPSGALSRKAVDNQSPLPPPQSPIPNPQSPATELP
ncbi:hypothetical protein XapA_02645 [Xanthomonas citri pv. punicae]|nr:hypothetical protein XapA_02645 [Xanthomonas citri pv. punicae]